MFIDLTPFKLLGNPIPLFPPSPYQGEGGLVSIREAVPLFDSPLVSLSLKGEGKEILERGEAPLLPTVPLRARKWVTGKPEGALAPSETILPLPLGKGKGIKGIGFPNKNLQRDRLPNNPLTADWDIVTL